MTESCPVLTPAERRIVDIIARADQALAATVEQALRRAVEQAAAGFRSAGSAEQPPAYEYFAAVLHQHMYCAMCGADPEPMAGGDPRIAARVLESGRSIANHYWAALSRRPAMLRNDRGSRSPRERKSWRSEW